MSYPVVQALIHLDAIRMNIESLKGLIPRKTKFMAVVKADAYGHGAVRVAQKALKSGADTLGVARLDEAIEIRQAGITAPLLVFGYFHPDQAVLAADLDITATLYNFDMAKALSRAACEKKTSIKAHLKMDTGMGRVGIIIPSKASGLTSPKESILEIKKILDLPGLEMEGIYTHLSSADSRDKSYTVQQLDLFDSLLDRLKKERIKFPLCHAANSAGILMYPRSHYDMVRAGISLYGLYPSPEVEISKAALTPAMTLRSIITSVRDVPEGFKVSYGMTYETPKKTMLASVPVGYADGYSRLFSSNGSMLVKGVKAPIAGRVCMDQTIIDVGHIPGVNPGDEVILLGSQGNVALTADELAKKTGTINYEIVSSLTARVKKIYSD